MIIHISGSSGSGKTTIGNKIKKIFNNKVVVFDVDDLHMNPLTRPKYWNELSKRKVLSGSKCFIFAAEDDFGIAPVEALSLGKPVIAFNKGGTTETVIPTQNGYLFDNPTAQSLEEKLVLFLEKGVTNSPAEIRKSALKFSRETFEKSIIKIINAS